MPILDYRKTGCNIHNSAVMAATIGSVSEFDNSRETWCTYIERLESFFNINDIAEEKKSDFLVSVITVMGSETYGLLKNRMAPTKPSTRPFSELVKTLGGHLDPSPDKWESGFVLDVVFKMTARALDRSSRSYDVCLYIAVMGKTCQQRYETNLCWASAPRPQRRNW